MTRPLCCLSYGLTLEDTAYSSRLPHYDEDGGDLRAQLSVQAAHGTVVLANTNTGACTYTPDKDLNGTDEFTYTIAGEEPAAGEPPVGGPLKTVSNEKTVTITALPVDDPITQLRVDHGAWGEMTCDATAEAWQSTIAHAFVGARCRATRTCSACATPTRRSASGRQPAQALRGRQRSRAARGSHPAGAASPLGRTAASCLRRRRTASCLRPHRRRVSARSPAGDARTARSASPGALCAFGCVGYNDHCVGRSCAQPEGAPMATPYPVDLRVDQPAHSSRLWAILTIFWIKFFALIPHFICLAVLGIAQAIVAIIGQIMVAFTGRYPEGMYDFLTGVVRWNTRVGAFFFSLTDRYPPFALKSIPEYPVDVMIRRPERPSRKYAIATLVVQVLMIAAIIGAATSGDNGSTNWHIDTNTPSTLGTLYLRILAAIPHLIIVAALAIVAFWLWIVMQWVILIIGRYPNSLYGFTAGVLRWGVRVNMYTLGLRDDYPPFTMQPSMTSAVQGPPPQGSGTWVE